MKRLGILSDTTSKVKAVRLAQALFLSIRKIVVMFFVMMLFDACTTADSYSVWPVRKVLNP